MTELLNVFQNPLRVFMGFAKPHTPAKEDPAGTAARKVRAGTKKIMTAAERQAFLRDSEYGRMAGVSNK